MFGQAKASFLVSNPREQRICTIGEAFRVLKSRIFQAKDEMSHEVKDQQYNGTPKQQADNGPTFAFLARFFH